MTDHQHVSDVSSAAPRHRLQSSMRQFLCLSGEGPGCERDGFEGSCLPGTSYRSWVTSAQSVLFRGSRSLLREYGLTNNSSISTWFNIDKYIIYIFFKENFFKFIYFIYFYFWLRWVFVAARRLSLVAVSGSCSSLRCKGFSFQWLLLLWSMGSRCAGFSSCGTWTRYLWLAGSRAQAQ